MYDLYWQPEHLQPAIKEGTFETIPAMLQHILELPTRAVGVWEGHDISRTHIHASVLLVSFI